VPSLPRRTAVDEHSVDIRQRWWHDATRAEVWAPAGDVFTLLWRTLAWGSGRYLRHNSRRLDSIEAGDPRVVATALRDHHGCAPDELERTLFGGRPKEES
jgi:hypothetical protein